MQVKKLTKEYNKKMTNRNNFISITNKEIYESIQSQNRKIDEILDNLNKRVALVEEKTGFNNKLIIGAYSFTMTVLGFVIAWFMKG